MIMENKYYIPDPEFYYTHERMKEAYSRFLNGEMVKLIECTEENSLHISYPDFVIDKRNTNYYTPDISEFHVGFEFEFDNTWGDWRKHILEEDDIRRGGWKGVGSGNERTCVFNKARVKYLDKEDIESLGFTPDVTYSSIMDNSSPRTLDYRFTQTVDNIEYRLLYCNYFITSNNRETEYRMLRISRNIKDDMRDPIFSGTIKNKSGLKRLLKQLNIK